MFVFCIEKGISKILDVLVIVYVLEVMCFASERLHLTSSINLVVKRKFRKIERLLLPKNK